MTETQSDPRGLTSGQWLIIIAGVLLVVGVVVIAYQGHLKAVDDATDTAEIFCAMSGYVRYSAEYENCVEANIDRFLHNE